MKYVPSEEPSLDVFYRKWNYDGATAEIFLRGTTKEVMRDDIKEGMLTKLTIVRLLTKDRHSV